MKEIIIFGDLPIATKIYKFVKKRGYPIKGVVIGNRNPKNIDPWPEPFLEIFARDNNIPILSLEEVSKLEKNSIELGILCRFSKIIKPEHFPPFKRGLINFHGGLLPEFGGVYSVCHTILEGSKIGGGTIHFIDEGIDTGKIVKRCVFNLDHEDTAYSLFRKTQTALYKGFKEIFHSLMNGTLKEINQEELMNQGLKSQYYNKKSLLNQKEFSLEDHPDTIDKKIRAFSFPGHEPAFFRIKDKKYHVKFNKNLQ